VATSAGKEDVALLLKQARVLDLIEETTTSDDAASSKPEPDILQAALRKAGESSAAALMIGDTPYDVEAAQRAGVPIITVRCGGLWNDADLRGSLSIFDDPADILAHFEFDRIRKLGHMANQADRNELKPSGVLVTAATSIGKVAGKIVGLVSRKVTKDAVTKTRRRRASQAQTRMKETVAKKKTRKTSKTVKSSARKSKP
jgi:hypothetical protein